MTPFVIQTARGNPATCEHLDSMREVTPSGAGCKECLEIGDTWVNLRLCLSCGHVGCCDSSKNRHARRHAKEATHPIVRSFQPGEDWMWCYPDAALIFREEEPVEATEVKP